ncbi:hypothetical protein ES705_10641 [subsurface metagenome]
MFDTRDERASAMSTPIFPLMPDPDGLEFSQADRQMILGVYCGILVGPPAPPPSSRALLIGRPPGLYVTKKCITRDFVYI